MKFIIAISLLIPFQTFYMFSQYPQKGTQNNDCSVYENISYKNEDKLLLIKNIQSMMEYISADNAIRTYNENNNILINIVSYSYINLINENILNMKKCIEIIDKYINNAFSKYENDDYILYDNTINIFKKDLKELDKIRYKKDNFTYFMASLRKLDGLLFMEATDWRGNAFPDRHVNSYNRNKHPLSGTWLSLPCRTVIGRAEVFSEMQKNLGMFAGRLHSCPSDISTYQKLAAHAKKPENFLPFKASIPESSATHELQTEPVLDTPPDGEWDRSSAVYFMALDPEKAETVLEKASTIDFTGALDYALYLHVFRRSEPDFQEIVSRLLEPLIENTGEHKSSSQTQERYNGTDNSIIEILKFIASPDNTIKTLRNYTIPCAILLKRPKLLESTLPFYGSYRDTFLPESGCIKSHYLINGFPHNFIYNYLDSTKGATGFFYKNRAGSIYYYHIMMSIYNYSLLEIVSPELLSLSEVKLEYPYQVWRYAGLYNHFMTIEIKSKYEKALKELTGYMEKMGLSRNLAKKAAKNGLFQISLGSSCGMNHPLSSLRQGLIDQQDISTLGPRLISQHPAESEALMACADRGADLEPLIHVAIIHPEALRYMLAHGADTETSNRFGKTAIMAAAQYDIIESLDLLIEYCANIDAFTWKRPDDYFRLQHDGRTALMYAAANGSLATIRRLLDAGASPFLTDSKGARAIHYLLGYGPDIPPNAKLSATERKEAIRLLY